MVNKCAAPGCTTGYNNKKPSGVSLHKFPSSPRLQARWIAAIHRDDFAPGASARICSLHFHDDDFIRVRKDTNTRRLRSLSSGLTKIYLKKTAIPSVFPNLPSYLSSPPAPQREEAPTSTKRLEMENQRIEENIQQMESDDCVENLSNLKDMFHACEKKPGHFAIYPSDDERRLLFTNGALIDSEFVMRSYVIVHSDLNFVAFKNGVRCEEQEYQSHMQFSRQVLKFSDFLNLLAFLNSDVTMCPIRYAVSLLEDYLQNMEEDEINARKLSFITEQLSLILKKPQNRRYSKNMILTAIILQSHSTACYESLLKADILTLPSVSSIRRICHGFQTETSQQMKSYLMSRRKNLNEFESTVVLIFDEMYVFETIDYSSNAFYGLATNKNAPASTILTFMVKSLAGKYCDVVGMFPIHGFNVEILNDVFRKVMQLVLEVGFDCVCCVSDNHPINRSFFKTLGGGSLRHSVPNPCDAQKDLFLLIDPTHNVKNIYNNFQRRTHIQFTETDAFPKIMANFNHIRDLYDTERHLALRMAHKLNEKVLNPSVTNRTSVKLAAAIFHESTYSALQYFSTNDESKKKWGETAEFLKLIHDLWAIVNVKTKDVGYRKRDEKRLPISSSFDERLNLLGKFEDLFKASAAQSGKEKLSNETLQALVLMCQTLRHIVPHLLQKGFRYVLLGHLQSDPLEHRFGQYRQRSGSNYFLAVKQVLESERKMKVSSLVNGTHCISSRPIILRYNGYYKYLM